MVPKLCWHGKTPHERTVQVKLLIWLFLTSHLFEQDGLNLKEI